MPDSYECISGRPYTGTPVAPGQTFEIGIAVLDVYNTTLQRIYIDVRSDNVITGDYMYQSESVISNSSCQSVNYRIYTDSEHIENNMSYTISADISCSNRIDLNVMILPCPVGFNFSSKDRKCDCTNLIKKFYRHL